MICSAFHTRGGGGSSIVKVPEDVPPARVYFFKLSSPVKGTRFANFSPFSLGKGVIFTKIGVANGAILKLWVAYSCSKFSQKPPS